MKEPQYDVDFFKSFDLVMNGLDNLEARRHVNRLCLAAETPLIESGTAGYLGQVRFCYTKQLVWLVLHMHAIFCTIDSLNNGQHESRPAA